MYITYRNWLKYGSETDEMECTTLYHETLDKALIYAHRYAKGVKFVSVQIYDEKMNLVYEICDYGANVIDYREEMKEQDLNNIEENYQEVVGVCNYKYCLIVSQYHYNHIQFLVGLDPQFHDKARNLIIELGTYKAGKTETETGDFKNKDDTKIIPLYSYTGAGKILFINCKDIEEVCKNMDIFREKEQTALMEYVRVGIKRAIEERHNYLKVRNMIAKHFKIL